MAGIAAQTIGLHRWSSCLLLLLLVAVVVVPVCAIDAFPPITPPPYLGAILYVGVGPFLFATEPQAAYPLASPVPLAATFTALVEAVTVDPFERTAYALVSDVAASATPVLYQVTFNGYNMSVTGQAALPDVPVNMTKGAISYSAKYQGVIVRTQFDNTAYIVSVPGFAVSEFTSLSISGHSSSDIFAYDDHGHNQSWIGPASVYTEVDAETGDVLYFDLTSGTSPTTGQFQAPPTLTYYDAFTKSYYALGPGYIYYGPDLPTSAAPLTPTPLGPTASEGVIPLRFIAYGSYIAPQVSSVWVSYSDGTLRKFLITYGMIQPIATVNMTSKAIAFQPSSRNIQPFSFPGLPTATVEFADTPGLLTNLYSAEGVVEKLYPVFGNFEFFGGELVTPSIWDKETDQFLGGSGLTSNLIRVFNTGSIPMYTYFNAWSAPMSPTVSTSISTIYNPVSTLNVSSLGLQYDVDTAALKFTASIQGDLANDVFQNNKSHIMTYGFCLKDDQALGKFDTKNYETKVTGTYTTYSFIRPGTFSLSLKVPSQFLSDNVPKFCPHTVKVGEDESGNFQLCIKWSFPFSTSSIFYDPDIGIILSPSDGGSNGGDGGTDSKALQIAIPVSIGGALLLCCVIIVVGVVILFFAQRHRRNQVKKVAHKSDIEL
eukprot:TRINITY_DN917_c1_g1_i4.p1 TRINITY_DN917_c1_g1~~TRINITY_DN917_c1_g1_i4.p1  ORF type:complete len:656 (-),score=105.20 TRINITY_DN917_c1_g1_i4:50-2017(-)